MNNRFMSAILILVFAILAAPGFAQKAKLYMGKANVLKDQKTINVIFDYENMGVGKYGSEDDYINERREEKNKKDPGSGDKWAEEWKSNRSNRFEPKFFELFNKNISSKKAKAGNYPDAKYTIIVKTTYTEPGWNVGVMRVPAHINVDIWIVETANLTKPKAKLSILKVRGQDAMGFDFETGRRLEESYAKCGKSLGKYLVKKAL